jgi:hypothetical protein
LLIQLWCVRNGLNPGKRQNSTHSRKKFELGEATLNSLNQQGCQTSDERIVSDNFRIAQLFVRESGDLKPVESGELRVERPEIASDQINKLPVPPLHKPVAS